MIIEIDDDHDGPLRSMDLTYGGSMLSNTNTNKYKLFYLTLN